MSSILAMSKPGILLMSGKANTHIAWIPSHRNILGNKIADNLAKRAAQEDNTKIHNIALPTTDSLRNYKAHLKDKKSHKIIIATIIKYNPKFYINHWFQDRKYIIQLQTKLF